jgi:predicted permease
MNSPLRLQLRWLDNLRQDLRFGFRFLFKQPGALVASIAALSLGIGLVIFGYCLIQGLFFRLLPFPESERLAYTSIAGPAYQEFNEQQTAFDRLAAFSQQGITLKAAGISAGRWGFFVTANFFEVLGVRPLLGRGFLPGEDLPGAAPVAMLSHRFWQEEYQGEPDAVGSTVKVDGQPTTIVGVMPRDFGFMIEQGIWIASRQRAGQGYDGSEYVSKFGFVFGRLKHTFTLAQARAELNAIAARLQPPNPDKAVALPRIRVGTLVDFPEPESPQPRMIMSGLFLMMFLVLCLACANVAMLTLGRSLKRSAELAVRSALGATRRRLVSQMLVENLILAAGGALGGMLVAAFVRGLFAAQLSVEDLIATSFWQRFHFDGRVFVFLIALTFVTNLLAGLAPALQATRRNVNELLKGETAGTTSRDASGFQKFLVVSQVAMSATILVATTVLLSYWQGTKVRLPFDPAATLIARINVLTTNAPGQFLEQLDNNVAQMAGLQASALTTRMAPEQGGPPIEIEGRTYERLRDHPQCSGTIVSPGFFHVFNLALLQGRNFQSDDRAGSLPVAIVNASFVQKFLTPGHVMGRRFRVMPKGEWLTIVGCAQDMFFNSYERCPAYYVPLSQQASPPASMSLVIRGGGKAADWTKPLRAEVARLNADAGLFSAETVKAYLDRDVSGYVLAARFLVICGTGSLFLAALGIYGLVTLAVNQRRREIGIRLALGATRERMMATILKPALRQIVIGLAAGLLLGFAVVFVIGTIVPLPTHQPWAYLAVGALLGGVGLFAVLLPARRGSRLDPMVALRYE